MKQILALLVIALLPSWSAFAAGPRVLLKETPVTLGGKSSTFFGFNINAVAGETITITIGEGADDSADHGVTWHLDSSNGKVISKGFTKERKKVSWNVKLPTSNPVLFVEDKDTNSGGPKKAGNGLTVAVSASGTAPAKPAPGKYDNYFGGPKAWYDSGKQLGIADRKAGKKANPSKYSDHYDKITEAEFRRGYADGYK